MASNTKGLSSSSSYEVTLNVNQTSQSVANNNSVVSWSLVVRKLVGSGYWGADSWASTYSVVIDGVTVSSGQKSYDFRGGAPANFTIASGTRTISHGSNGAKSISASASWKDNVNGLGTGAPALSMALTTIPRASDFTLSPSTVNFGGVTRVSIKKKSSGFTSRVRLSWGTQNITLWDKITWTEGDYTLPTSLTPANATTGWGTIHVDTYNGTTLVGTKSARLNGTVPNNSTFNPSATAPTFTEKNTAVSGGMSGQWVAGKSKIEYKATFATRMNATVKSAVFKVVRNGVTFNHTATISGNTATFTESPTVTTTYSVQLVVTDSRGRTATSSASSFTMVAYSAPKLTSVSAVRDNSDSTKILINATATGSSVSALNTMTLRVFTKLRGNSSWGTAKHVVTSTNGSIVLTNHVLTGYVVLSSYDVLVQLDDELSGTTYSQSSVGTSSVLLDAYKGVGLAIGKYYEPVIGGALQVGGNAIFDNNATFGGTVTTGGNFTVSGSKNAVHPTRDGFRLTPAYETAESYLGDIGEDKTTHTSEVKVWIETLFFDVINTDVPYQVFLQSYGEGHVWVSERNKEYFIVKSSLPNTPFAYEIKGKRRGYESDRLVLSEITYEDSQTMEGLHGGKSTYINSVDGEE